LNCWLFLHSAKRRRIEEEFKEFKEYEEYKIPTCELIPGAKAKARVSSGYFSRARTRALELLLLLVLLELLVLLPYASPFRVNGSHRSGPGIDNEPWPWF
jgi:hypothetical protein